jgi:GAF domain-containing protein
MTRVPEAGAPLPRTILGCPAINTRTDQPPLDWYLQPNPRDARQNRLPHWIVQLEVHGPGSALPKLPAAHAAGAWLPMTDWLAGLIEHLRLPFPPQSYRIRLLEARAGCPLPPGQLSDYAIPVALLPGSSSDSLAKAVGLAACCHPWRRPPSWMLFTGCLAEQLDGDLRLTATNSIEAKLRLALGRDPGFQFGPIIDLLYQHDRTPDIYGPRERRVVSGKVRLVVIPTAVPDWGPVRQRLGLEPVPVALSSLRYPNFDGLKRRIEELASGGVLIVRASTVWHVLYLLGYSDILATGDGQLLDEEEAEVYRLLPERCPPPRRPALEHNPGEAALARLTQELSGNPDRHDRLKILLDRCIQLLSCCAGNIAHTGADPDWLEVVTRTQQPHGLTGAGIRPLLDAVPAWVGIHGQVLASGQTVIARTRAELLDVLDLPAVRALLEQRYAPEKVSAYLEMLERIPACVEVPLVYGGRIIGVMCLHRASEGGFAEVALAQVHRVAELVAREVAQLQANLEQSLPPLHKATLAPGDPTLRWWLECVARALGVRDASLYLRASATGLPTRHLSLTEAEADPESADGPGRLWVPIQAGEDVFGELRLACPDAASSPAGARSAFTDQDRLLAEKAAARLADFLHGRHKRERDRALEELLRRFLSAHDLCLTINEAVQRMLGSCCCLIRMESGWEGSRGEVERILDLFYVSDERHAVWPQVRRMDQGVAGLVWHLRQCVVIEDTHTYPLRAKIFEKYGEEDWWDRSGCIIVAPIRVGSQVLGTLAVHRTHANALLKSDAKLIDAVACLAGTAFQDQRESEKLQIENQLLRVGLAHRDELLGAVPADVADQQLLRRLNQVLAEGLHQGIGHVWAGQPDSPLLHGLSAREGGLALADPLDRAELQRQMGGRDFVVISDPEKDQRLGLVLEALPEPLRERYRPCQRAGLWLERLGKRPLSQPAFFLLVVEPPHRLSYDRVAHMVETLAAGSSGLL